MLSFLDPSKVINQLDLSPGMIAVDFGSGSGGWVIPLAKKLKEGRVFAVDVQKEPLSALMGKAKLDRIFNIQTVQANVEKLGTLKLGNSFADLILMTNLLFQVSSKENVFGEARRILKQGGRLLVVDWSIDSTLGPESGRIDKEEVKKLAQIEKFDFEEEIDSGENHFGLLFIKK